MGGPLGGMTTDPFGHNSGLLQGLGQALPPDRSLQSGLHLLGQAQINLASQGMSYTQYLAAMQTVRYGALLGNSAASREAQEVMDEVESHETLEEMLPRMRKLQGSWKVSTFAHRKCSGRVTKRLPKEIAIPRRRGMMK